MWTRVSVTNPARTRFLGTGRTIDPEPAHALESVVLVTDSEMAYHDVNRRL